MPSERLSGRRLRVVVVSHAYNRTGRMRPFAALGDQVELTLVGPQEYNNVRLEQPELSENAPRLEVISLPARLVGRSQFLLRGLAKTLRSRRPDVVVVEYDPWHLQFLQVLFGLTMARSGARIVPVVKKNTYRAHTSALGRGKRLLARWGIRRSSVIIAASGMARDMYVRVLGVPESRIVVQPHLPVDVSRFRPREGEGTPRPLRIGFVGKIGELKGVPELLHAFDQVLDRTGASLELWLAGQITDPDVGAKISSARQVRHVGTVDNDELHLFMNEIDVFVMPARILPDHQEHDGRAVLEAMASGVPCVVSDSGILPELVSGDEGRVFRAGDAVSLANCLEEIVQSPQLRVMLGTHARQLAMATVSPEVVSAQRLVIFNKTVEEPR